VLGNDTDLDGDVLTAAVITEPAHGSLTPNASGTFSYTPAANYSGSDSFTFKANDGLIDSAPATVTITVTAATRGSYSIWAASNSITGGGTGDADHDGLTNLDEYTLGTDPHASNTSLLTLAPAPGNSFTLMFPARAASGAGYEGLKRKYDVQVSSDLAPGSWQNVNGFSGIVGANQSVVVPLSIAGPHKFYRLSVRLE